MSDFRKVRMTEDWNMSDFQTVRMTEAWNMSDFQTVRMTKEEIKQYNQRILGCPGAKTVDLSAVPEGVDAKRVYDLISSYSFGNYSYLNGRELRLSDQEQLLKKCNLDQLHAVSVQYGIVIASADVRSFPTMDVLMESKEEWHFDYFQETKLMVGEAVWVYHYTADRKWMFVQAGNYAGWVQSVCIAVCSRQQLLNALTKRSSLPYTMAHVLKLAFRLLGTPYSWGNKGAGLDCSGIVLEVYRQFGFLLPRNTSSMAACKELLMDVRVCSERQKREILHKVLPGSLLLMKGHVAMYLGTKNAKEYILHGFSKYYDHVGQPQEVMACAITTMDLHRADGSTFLQGTEAIWEIKGKSFTEFHKRKNVFGMEDKNVQSMYF